MMIAYLLSLIVGQMLNAGAETDLIYRILLYRQLSDIFPDRPEKPACTKPLLLLLWRSLRKQHKAQWGDGCHSQLPVYVELL